MPTCVHTCVGAREENPTPFHRAVTLSRKTAANAIIVSIYNGTPISESRIDDSSKTTPSTDAAEFIAIFAYSFLSGLRLLMVAVEAPRNDNELSWSLAKW